MAALVLNSVLGSQSKEVDTTTLNGHNRQKCWKSHSLGGLLSGLGSFYICCVTLQVPIPPHNSLKNCPLYVLLEGMSVLEDHSGGKVTLTEPKSPPESFLSLEGERNTLSDFNLWIRFQSSSFLLHEDPCLKQKKVSSEWKVK